MQSSGTNLTLIRVYKDYKNYPLPFCNSIQESNKSMFESRSCTHVLIQEKYLQVIKHKTLFFTSRKSKPLGVFGFGSTKEERKKKTPRCVCISYEKNIHLGFAYILHKTWSSRHKGGGFTPLPIGFGAQRGFPEPSLVSMFCLVLLS